MNRQHPSLRRRKDLPPRRVAVRPAIEFMEDRTLLATHLVSVATGTGVGSLYDAIAKANLDNSGASNVIAFAPAVTAVQLDPGTALDPLTKQVEVDGGSGVTIDGGNTAFDGFRFASTATSSQIHDLTIQNLQGAAVLVQAGSVTVKDNTLGAAGNPIGYGVKIDGSGGAVTGVQVQGNTIGFATSAGVRIAGAGATNNAVVGNFIGTDSGGANLGNAIGVEIAGASNNAIGGTGASDGNTIGFNATAGVRITGAGASGNAIAGNFIGVNAGGQAMGNPIGVDVLGAGANTVGGATAAAGNVVDAASVAGVRVAGSSGAVVSNNTIGLAGSTAVGVLIDGSTTAVSNVTVSANTIGRTNTAVIAKAVGATAGSPRVRITGNLIGTNASGANLGNGIGVLIDGSSGASASVVVGGTGASDGNTIGFNTTAGVRITGTGATGNTVAGNRIGVNSGGQAMGNPIGVDVLGAGGNTIGGSTAAAGNVIVASSITGVLISGTATTGNFVLGNRIGDSGAGLGNGYGVQIFNSNGNVVGGAGAEANVVTNNVTAGVAVLSGSQNRILNNTYQGANGAATPAGDVVVAPGANGGIQPLSILTVSPSGSDVRIRFSAPLQAGDVVQVYGLTATSRTFAVQQTIAGTPDQITVPASALGSASTVLVTVTRTTGTSAFSNAVTLASLLVVNTVDFAHLPGQTSLWDAINNANAGAGAQTITFNLPLGSTVIDASSNPLPNVLKPDVTIVGPGAAALSVQGGAGDGLVFTASAGGGAVSGLTFGGFGGAAVRVLSAGVSVTSSVFNANAVGVALQGANNQISDSTFSGSTTAGVLVSGAGATGNTIQDSTFSSNADGVQVQAGSGNAIGASGHPNTFADNSHAGVSLLSGSQNTVQYNLFQGLNGGAPAGKNDVLVAASANGGILPPSIQTVSPSGTDLLIRFTAPLQAGDVVQVYGLTAGARSFAAQQTIVGTPSQITVPASALGSASTVLVTVTRASGTSAFSNSVTMANLLIVDTVDFVHPLGRTSLWDAINNANSIGGPGVPSITFALKDAGGVPITDPTAWVVDVSANPLPAFARSVAIDGTIVIAGVDSGKVTLKNGFDGLTFEQGADNGLVQKLTFTGFTDAAVVVYANGVTISQSDFVANPTGTGVVLAGDGGVVKGSHFLADATTHVGNAIGVQILGTNNKVGTPAADLATLGRNAFEGAAVAAIRILAFASGNDVFSNVIGPASADDSWKMNRVGVEVLGGTGTIIGGGGIGNTIQYNATQGISVSSGNHNQFLENSFQGNGSATAGVYPLSGNIFVGAGANDDAKPGTLSTAVKQAGVLTLVVQGDYGAAPSVSFQVYKVGDNGTGGPVATATGVPVPGSSGRYLITLAGGVANLDDRLAVIATLAAASATGNSTEFSNIVRITEPNVVVNTDPDGPGSLAGVVAYVNGLSNPSVDERHVYFRIPVDTYPLDAQGYWTILINQTIVVTANAFIDGSDTASPAAQAHPVRVMPGAGLPPDPYSPPVPPTTALRFAAGSDGGRVSSLRIEGFATSAIQVTAADVTIDGNSILGPNASPSVMGSKGIDVSAGGSGAVIDGNLIGRWDAAVSISGGAGGNRVADNRIGTDGNVLGDTDAATYGNHSGVLVDGSSLNVITGNLIGNSKNGGAGAGVWILGGSGATGNVVDGNQIGVAPNRIGAGQPGNDVGVLLEADGNLVGDARVWPNAAGSSNVIGNNAVGISIKGSNNVVAGNRIGTDAQGNNQANRHQGILIEGSTSTGNQIGLAKSVAVGTADEAVIGANVLGWNDTGIEIVGGGGNFLRNNFVGVSPGGTTIANTIGVALTGSVGNRIGPDAGAPASPNWVADVAVGGNYISGNRDQGVLLRPGPEKDAPTVASDDNVIVGNLIGRGRTLKTQPTGSPVAGGVDFLGNRGPGIEVQGGRSNVIGGGSAAPQAVPEALVAGVANLIVGNQRGVLLNDASVSGPAFPALSNSVLGNLVSGNSLDGILVTGDLGKTERVATIAGNFVGTSWDGKSGNLDFGDSTLQLPSANGLSGVSLQTAGVWNRILGGAAVVVQANLLSGNGLNGIEVNTDEHATNLAYGRIVVTSNIIGLSRDGKAADAASKPLGNTLDGVRIVNVGGVRVGAGDAASANVLSGNLGRGLEVFWTISPDPSDAALADALTVNVLGNRIGTSLDGTSIDGGTGNVSDGVFLLGDVLATIRANLIGGNRGAGVHVNDGVTEGFSGRIRLESNWIGTDAGGRNLNNGSDGIFLDKLKAAAGQIAITGNSIGANRANGINVLDSSHVAITGNYVGDVQAIKNPTGAAPSNGNSANGISLTGSSNVTIGGTDDADRNWISGNRGNGVVIVGNGEWQGNELLGNYVGTDESGRSGVPNYNSGVLINGSSGNEIGEDHPVGDALGGGNLISGNRLYGVIISGGGVGAGGNTIAGNRIGTAADGFSGSANSGLANSADGVFILNNAGTVPSAGNLVSHNVISGNAANGVRIFGTSAWGNQVAGNYVGLGIDGTTKVANMGVGVMLDNAGYNTIGGANVISGNGQSGVMVSSTDQKASAAGTRIVGNYVGLDASGSKAVPNAANGVFIFGASHVTVEMNTISGNSADGVQIFSPSIGAPANGNTIYANLIGTDATGAAAVGNQGNGVTIINGFGNRVGLGDEPGFLAGGVRDAWRNVISGNANGVVVDVQASYAGSKGPATLGAPNHVSGNVIGLDRTGTRNLGNRYAGVYLNNADGTVVGYANGFTDAGAGSRVLPGTMAPAPGWASNVISGNGQVGIQLTGTTGNAKVRGNYLGTDVQGRSRDDQGAGLNLASAQAAILIDAKAAGNWIGGAAAGESIDLAGTGNLVTQSTQVPNPNPDRQVVGILVNSLEARGNRIQSNMIGLDAQGGSGSNDVGVLLNNSTDTIVGAAGAGRNVITGNAFAGVEINGPLATRNVLHNNYIGVRGDGVSRPAPRVPSGTPGYDPSQESGVLITQASGNSVGSSEQGLGNVISGNGNGVNIASPQSNQPAASANVVVGNVIGTDASGLTAVPNFRSGVFVTAAPNTQILDNLISANGLSGIQIFGGQTQRDGRGNAAGLGVTIVGNTIGLNRDNQIAFSPFDGRNRIHPDSDFPNVTLPNDGIVVQLGAQQHGVVVIGASGTRVGLPSRGNVISGNTLTGVYISKLDDNLQSYATPVDNVVQNNYMRTNGIYGVFRYDAPNGNSTVADDFTGTPIPIGDFLTGQNLQASGANRAQSILLGTVPTTTPNRPGRPNRPGLASRPTPPPRPTPVPRPTPPAVRPAPIQRPGLSQAARMRLR